MKIKDWTRTIGFVNRGGFFGPSNEKSEKKLGHLLEEIHFDEMPHAIPRETFNRLMKIAKAHGWVFTTINRGYNR